MTVQELLDQLKYVPKDLRGEVEVLISDCGTPPAWVTPVEVELSIPARELRLLI
jgi:hypothetical protein